MERQIRTRGAAGAARAALQRRIVAEERRKQRRGSAAQAEARGGQQRAHFRRPPFVCRALRWLVDWYSTMYVPSASCRHDRSST